MLLQLPGLSQRRTRLSLHISHCFLAAQTNYPAFLNDICDEKPYGYHKRQHHVNLQRHNFRHLLLFQPARTFGTKHTLLWHLRDGFCILRAAFLLLCSQAPRSWECFRAVPLPGCRCPNPTSSLFPLPFSNCLHRAKTRCEDKYTNKYIQNQVWQSQQTCT